MRQKLERSCQRSFWSELIPLVRLLIVIDAFVVTHGFIVLLFVAFSKFWLLCFYPPWQGLQVSYTGMIHVNPCNSHLEPLSNAADEFRNGPHPEPFVAETEVTTISRKLLFPFIRCFDWVRTWWANRKYAQYHRLRPQPHFNVLPMEISRIWIDALGLENEDCPIVDEELVRNLLIKHGELERANNPRLVQEMVVAARSATGCLDAESFANAVSSDLTDWNVGSEDILSTFFEDVFGTDNPADVKQLEAVDEQNIGAPTDLESFQNHEKERIRSPRCSRVCTSLFCLFTLGWCCGYCTSDTETIFNVEPSNIDFDVDAHSSLVAAVLIWIFSLLT